MWSLLKNHGGLVMGAVAAAVGVYVGEWHAVAYGALVGLLFGHVVDFLHDLLGHE